MDKKVLYDLSYGLYAIGVKDNSRDCGCIVNTVFQISSEGPIIALSMNKENYTWGLIEKTKRFSVSVLHENVDGNVIAALGFQSGKDVDKWDGLNYSHMFDLPIVSNCASYMICEVKQVVDVHTHMLILAKVVEAEKVKDENVMTYAYYRNVKKGTAPKNAPTYQALKDMYTCSVCGYVYDGPDFEKEPDSYVCPICKAKKEKFVKN